MLVFISIKNWHGLHPIIDCFIFFDGFRCQSTLSMQCYMPGEIFPILYGQYHIDYENWGTQPFLEYFFESSSWFCRCSVPLIIVDSAMVILILGLFKLHIILKMTKTHVRRHRRMKWFQIKSKSLTSSFLFHWKKLLVKTNSLYTSRNK